MIIGIGCDIIEVERIQNAIEKNSRFCEKLYTLRKLSIVPAKQIPISPLQFVLLPRKQ